MTRPRRFDLIVFDWDGTLFDSTALITRCIQAACADLGTPVPSDRDASYVIGLGLNEALQHAAPDLQPERYGELAFRHFFLQPMDSADTELNTERAIDYCLRHPRWRLSIQTHKLVGLR